MKRRTLSIISFCTIFAFTTLSSCSGEHEAETTHEDAVEESVIEEETSEKEIEVATPDGKELFTSSGCVACHIVDAKTVGPSLKTIAEAYDGNKDEMVLFLKEEGEAIVDPEQYAVMQVNLAVTKEMSNEDLNAIVDYILSTK